jgi:hypothetical protein
LPNHLWYKAQIFETWPTAYADEDELLHPTEVDLNDVLD